METMKAPQPPSGVVMTKNLLTSSKSEGLEGPRSVELLDLL